MKKLPDIIGEAWARRDGPFVLATTSRSGTPNAIYVNSVHVYDDRTIVVADNYFDKTRTNILAGSRGALLFLTKQRLAYQLKGQITYHTSGPVFAAMKQHNRADLPGVAAAALHVEEAYCGAERLT
ncbi:MAG TPA: pyridoxamine 5'-phosphate oxidase family protein [Opitutaceae bacterium]